MALAIKRESEWPSLSAMLERTTRALGARWLIATGLAVIAFTVAIAIGGKGTAGALAVLYLLFFLIVALFALLLAGWRRFFGARAPWDLATADGGAESGSEFVEPNMGAIGLAIAAAALAVISVFLPRVESAAFLRIQENTLIQSGDGWIIIGCAIGIAGAAYRVYRDRANTWAVLILGLVILGVAIYAGSGDRLELKSAGSVFGEERTDIGSPGIGIYAAGAAGVLAIFAGWSLAGRSGTAFETESDQRTKTCPECAETVLSAARVCKHCGYRFAPSAHEYPQ